MDYAKGVKLLRGMKSVSQKEFAKLCSISHDNVVCIEEKVREPTSAEIIKICNAFKIKECIFEFLCIEEKDMSRKQQIQYKKHKDTAHLVFKVIFIDD